MILRSVGIAGAIVVGLAVARGADAAAGVLAIVGTRIDALAVRRVAVDRRRRTGRWARLARWVMRRPSRSSSRRSRVLLLLGPPFLHVRFNAPGRHDPAGVRPVARGVRPARRASSARASSRRSSLAVRTDRPGDRARRTSPRCSTTRAGWPPTRGSRASRASSTSTRGSAWSSTSCSTRTRPGRPTGSSSARSAPRRAAT